MQGLDLEKVKEVELTLSGVAELAFVIALGEYIKSSGNNWIAKNTLLNAGVLISSKINNTTITDDTIQLNS